MKTCVEIGCYQRVHALGLCRKHHDAYQDEITDLRTRLDKLEHAIEALRHGVPA